MQPTKKQKTNDGTMRPRLPGIADLLEAANRDITSHMSLSYSPQLPSAIPQTSIAMPVPMVPTITYGPNGDDVPSPFPVMHAVRRTGQTDGEYLAAELRAIDMNQQLSRG